MNGGRKFGSFENGELGDGLACLLQRRCWLLHSNRCSVGTTLYHFATATQHRAAEGLMKKDVVQRIQVSRYLL
jgi:hypothetical protein